MNTNRFRSFLLWLAPALLVGTAVHLAQDSPTTATPEAERLGTALEIQYLEIVTPDVDATCSALEAIHGVRFSEPIAAFGEARTAPLEGGGRIGVRAPLRADEAPVVRPYLLVDDIEAAVETSREKGGQIAHPPLEIPGLGHFAIYLQGGIDHGLLQI